MKQKEFTVCFTDGMGHLVEGETLATADGTMVGVVLPWSEDKEMAFGTCLKVTTVGLFIFAKTILT